MQVAYDADLVNSAKNRLYIFRTHVLCNSPVTNSPNHSCCR